MSLFVTKFNHLKGQIEADNNSELNSISIRKYLRKYVVEDRTNGGVPLEH